MCQFINNEEINTSTAECKIKCIEFSLQLGNICWCTAQKRDHAWWVLNWSTSMNYCCQYDSTKAGRPQECLGQLVLGRGVSFWPILAAFLVRSHPRRAWHYISQQSVSQISWYSLPTDPASAQFSFWQMNSWSEMGSHCIKSHILSPVKKKKTLHSFTFRNSRFNSRITVNKCMQSLQPDYAVLMHFISDH